MTEITTGRDVSLENHTLAHDEPNGYESAVSQRHEIYSDLGEFNTSQISMGAIAASCAIFLDSYAIRFSIPIPLSLQCIQLSLVPLMNQPATPGFAKEWVKSGSIARLHDRDDADIWKGWRRRVYQFAPLFMVANSSLYVFYLALRIYCIIMAQRADDMIFIAAWIFVAIELCVAVPSLLQNGWTVLALKKRGRAKLRLVGNEVPTVDVFVTCCGEEDELVLDTVRGACNQDFPARQFRVIVLDDGKSAKLKTSVEQLALTTYPNLYYVAREKIPGKPHHFKAGNLNNGLEYTDKLPGGPGEFMAALDADMIPEPDWLRAILPHLLVDSKMALACPPQLFYNVPASDPLAQSLDFFVHVIEPIKDALGVAWCTGSGYIVRRQALEDIGRFPLGSLAEDVATSTLMLGKGWKTAYIHEQLQFGTIPEDYGGHLKQRTRWAIGTVDTAFKLKFCVYGDAVRQMTFAQRFSGFLYAVLSLYTLVLTISLFAVPVILLWGKQLVAYATEQELRWLIWACFASTVANRLCEFTLYTPSGYHTGQRGSRFQLWMSPYIALCIVRSFVLPSWLGGQAQAFKPTGSLGSTLNERDPATRKNMFMRLRVILLNYLALFHFLFVYTTLCAVALSTYRCFASEIEMGFKAVVKCLITHAFWPPSVFLFICTSLWTPISYAIDPPCMPDREELLDRDSKSQIAHPTQKSKEIAFGGQAAWFEFEHTVSTIATILVFCFSFYI
ncbi:glycosyl transferase [Penicillium cataractarum]|uniref:Glycosyl transferase n=1 Tax=Penicillium cataractarum TaxID=2100454 RepID=A0A9W9RIJ3_9EURO|nr:glycosyl transferase [Penicillium cataractarum]KAJ5359464.1 glycosyl transferase [Penicillium cataractarum]